MSDFVIGTLVVSSILLLVFSVVRSIQTERHYRQRDLDFKEYLLLLQERKPDKAKALYDKYFRDPVFRKYADPADWVYQCINKQKQDKSGRTKVTPPGQANNQSALSAS